MAKMPRSILALVVAALLLSGCSKVTLYNKLSEQDANEMLAALSSGGIDARKSSPDDKLWLLQVDKQDLSAALDALRAQGLPRERHVNIGEVFRKQGLVSTPTEERIRYIYAVSQELEHTLAQIDGVQVARVHVVMPSNDPLNDKLKPSSAAVFIKHQAEANLQLLTPAIKNLVLASIEGLAYDNVALSFFPAQQSRAQPMRWTRYLGLDITPQSVSRLNALLISIALGLSLFAATVWWRYRSWIGDDFASLRELLANTRVGRRINTRFGR